jgi:hypothetical protein
MSFPDALPIVVGIVSWQSYRVIGFKLIFDGALECHGGKLLPTAWILPLGQDGIIGSLAWIACLLLATCKGSTMAYIVSCCYVWWGIVDYCIGMVVEKYMPPNKSAFGPHVPGWMMLVWLFMNLALEVTAFALLLSKDILNWFITCDAAEPLSITDGVLGGWWIALCIGSALLMTVGFPVVVMVMDAFFKKLGFPHEDSKPPLRLT